MAPALSRDMLTGGYVHFDGQLEDDARLVIALARTAAGFGARVITYARVLELAGDGARARDVRSGDEFTVRARAVVNATGVWAGTLVDGVRLRPSRGSHIVLRAATLGHPTAALNLPVPGERSRYVFAVPEPEGRVYAGLTDEPVDGPVPDVPGAPEADIEFLLTALSHALATPLRRDDVIGAFAGLRPLLDAEGGRCHGGHVPPPRLVHLERRGAHDRGREAHHVPQDGRGRRGRRGTAASAQCRTVPDEAPAPGRRGPAGRARPAQRSGAPDPPVRHGGAVSGRAQPRLVCAIIAGQPTLGEAIAPGVPVTGAELVWGLRHEGASRGR